MQKMVESKEIVLVFKEPWYNEYNQEVKQHSNREYKQPARRELVSLTKKNESLQALFGKQESVDYTNLQTMRMRTVSKNKS